MFRSKTRDLPPGHVACRWCGVAVPTPDQPYTTTRPHPIEITNGIGGRPAGPLETHYGECSDCARFGDHVDAQDARIAAALDALGESEEPLNSSLRWAFVMSPEAPPPVAWWVEPRSGCAVKRWSHVDLKPLRAAYAAALAEQVITPDKVDVQSPDGDPCAACGIGTVTVDGLQWSRGVKSMDDLWRPIYVNASRRGPEHVNTYMCRDCEADYEAAGNAWGQTFFEESALAAHGRTLQTGETWPGIRPWIWTGREKANVARWGHLRLVDPEPEVTDADRIAALEAQVAALTQGHANG